MFGVLMAGVEGAAATLDLSGVDFTPIVTMIQSAIPAVLGAIVPIVVRIDPASLISTDDNIFNHMTGEEEGVTYAFPATAVDDDGNTIVICRYSVIRTVKSPQRKYRTLRPFLTVLIYVIIHAPILTATTTSFGTRKRKLLQKKEIQKIPFILVI